METLKGTKISTLTPQELLGRPLNDVERKYAPPKLYLASNEKVPLPIPRSAIVGSRRASPESMSTAGEIAKVLVRKGVIIVSGLAEGIDTAAHKASIEGGGRTIAVLGTPVDRVYPKENFKLQEEIMHRHYAVSQFPIGHRTRPKDFVLRNRTMALLCDASIIVEAGETSGSLHEGWEALRLGRPLFIWSSLMKDSALSWPKKMAQYGAVELDDPEQVLDVLPSSERILEVLESVPQTTGVRTS